MTQPDLPAGPEAEGPPARHAAYPSNGSAPAGTAASAGWQAALAPAPAPAPAPGPGPPGDPPPPGTDWPTDPIPVVSVGWLPPPPPPPPVAEWPTAPAPPLLVPGPGPGYGPGPEPGPARGRRSRVRLGLAVALALLGVAGLVASLAGVVTQILPRKFSPAQQRQIMDWEVASRWRTWPAGKIFPATVSYQLPYLLFGTGSGLTLSAHRMGVAAEASCAAATDQVLARMLDARGCEGVLRSTYTDSTGSLAVTIGVVIARGTAPQVSSLPAGQGLRPTIKAVPFPGTLADRFGDRQRQLSGAFSRGPYLVLYTAGYTDGRSYGQESLNPYTDSEMTSLGSGLAQSVGAHLGVLPSVPRCPGAPGC